MSAIPQIYRAGILARIDTIFSGLVPCKVLEVLEPGDGNRVAVGKILVRVTAKRRGYSVGERLEVTSSDLVPVSHIRTRTGHYRTNTNYRWE